MRRTLSRAVALAGLLVGSAAFAQQPGPGLPQPRIAAVFPPGAKAGAAVEVTVSGTDLDGDAPALLFSDPRIKAEFVVPPEPADPKAKDKKPAPAMGKKKGGPTATAKFKVTVPADVPPGSVDARVSTDFGVSNPRAFVVGTLPELDEKEPNNDVPEAQPVTLGTVVNGVIAAPTDVDYLKFPGKAGQRVIAHCATSSIDSRARPQLELYAADARLLAVNRMYSGNDALVDAVLPADGEYLLRTAEFAYQFGGPEYFYRLTLTAGPWVDAVFPPVVAAGKPTPVTVYGRNLPNGQPVPGSAPSGKPPLQSVAATVTPPTDPKARTALNFPGRIAPPAGTQDGFAFRFADANAVPVFLADGPVVLESDQPNDTAATAQEVAAPCDVAGRIEKQYDRDFYRFAAKKGDTLWIELFADRVGAGMDTYLAVRTDKGQDVSPELDDDTDSLHPTAFPTRSGDPPAYKFTAKEDGTFLVLVGSREANVTYGPRCVYRLRVGKPAPDFRAVVMPRTRDLPAGATLPGSGTVALDVFVDRKDGFAGPVTATATKLPPGVTATPTVIGTGAKWGTLVLSVAPDAKEFTGPVAVACAGTIGDKPVSRDARPGSVTWGFAPGQGQNAPAVSRLDRELVLAVRPAEKAKFRLTADLAAAKVKTKDKDGKEKEDAAPGPLFVKPGDKITVPVKLNWQDAEARANPLNVALEPTHAGNNQAPLTVNNGQPMAVPKDKADAPVVIDVKSSAPPGTYAVTLRGDTQIQYVRDPNQKDKKTAATVTAFAAPFEVTVLPLSLGKFSASVPDAGAFKPGATADVLVKVERAADYAGPFEVVLNFPKDGPLSAKPVTLPAGADAVRVPVAVAADAKPGAGGNVGITATVVVHGKYPVTHETKTTVTVVKAK